MLLCKIYRYVKRFVCRGIPKYAKHWRLSWFRYETFIIFLTFRFSTRGERDTIFTMLTVRPASTLNSLTQQTRAHPAANNWTGLAQIWIPTRFVQSQISTNCFFQNTQESQPIASGHDVIHIPGHISNPGFLLWHLWLSHPPRASVNTCTQCVHLTRMIKPRKMII